VFGESITWRRAYSSDNNQLKGDAMEIEEIKGKIKRIEELKDWGLNTPRMFFVEQNSFGKLLTRCIDWAKNINEEEPNQIFNIRTYRRKGKQESVQTIHSTDIPFLVLSKTLVELNRDFNCMVDAETPDNGRFAGNAYVTSNISGRPDHIVFEYCRKEIRAMVRDHNKSISIILPIEYPIFIEEPFKQILKDIIKTRMFNTIFEWTWFSKPAGVERENLVYWEYRN